MFVLDSKETFDGKTSEARPATIPPSANGRSTLCWTGDRNSDSLSAARVVDSFPDAGKSRIDPPETILPQASSLAPALTSFHERTCLAWVSFEGRINVGMLRTIDDGKSFFVEDTVPLTHSSHASPALAATPLGTERFLFLAWSGRDAEHSINVMVSRDGRGFGWDLARPEGLVNLKTRERSHHSPALAWNRFGLQMAWTGTDGRINHMPLTKENQPFPIEPQTAKKRTFEASSLLEARSPHGPSLAPHGLDRPPKRSSHELVLGWTGPAGRIYLLLLDLRNGSVSELSRLTESSIDGPQLVDAGMGPHLAWTGTDGPRTINLARIRRAIGDPVQPPLGPLG